MRSVDAAALDLKKEIFPFPSPEMGWEGKTPAVRDCVSPVRE